MNCPTCGAPNVMLHKDIWECGWCGDSGPIPRRILEQRKAARERQNAWWKNTAGITRNAALTFVDAVTRLLPTYPESKAFAWRVVLCQVSAGLIESGLWNGTWGDKAEQAASGRIFYPYRALANDLADFSGISNSATIEKAIRSRQPLFQSEGQLTDKVCGKFWELMIGQLPPYDKEDPSMQGGHLYTGRAFGGKNLTESAIEDILCSILPLASFFAGCTGEKADTRNNRFLGYFTEHWKRLRGEKVDPMDYEDSAVARIVEQFPELKDEYKIEDLFNMHASELLEGIYSTDPQRAIAMWCSLPEKQKPLQDDFLSEDFFYIFDFLWYYKEFDEDAIAPLLDAIQKDDTFAEMVFRSRYVCTLHLYLIQAAFEQRKIELAEHLYALLQSNPLPREDWREDADEFESLMEEYADVDDNTPMYRYCFVRVDHGRRYSYLTNGLPVKKGDHVRVPYGKNNELKEGVVHAVGNYTRDTAPWPPEKTKRVLEILPKPQEPVGREPAEPKPQPKVQQPQEQPKPVKAERAPVAQKPETTEPQTPAAAEIPEQTLPTGGTPNETLQEIPPRRKKNLVPFLVVAVLAVMVVGGVLLSRHSQAKRLAAWEQQYQTAAELFAAGNYKKAVEVAEGVPENIAEQPALLTVAKAGVLLDTDTEESLCDGLDLLKCAWDLGSYSEQGSILQAKLTDRLQETFYEKAITLLHRGDPYAALSYLQKLGDYKDPSLKAELAEQLQEALYEKAITLLHKGDSYTARSYLLKLGDYKDAATILLYTHALIDSQSFNVIIYRWALESLQTIPINYDGEFAEEIIALRNALPAKIAEQEKIDAQIAANQSQQQKPKPPQTFNYGGGSTDTGPGSGHSLREDYGDPEDLYEDGDYDDLDEAWDEWEEGW